ncbi:hypothetical protein [Pedobacter sp. GR22-6]|uniref:hypothetical protein n=1 Tax=Pedobacter sp. GR22-6 TaxID=3127957 RepID=UPI00307F01A1
MIPKNSKAKTTKVKAETNKETLKKYKIEDCLNDMTKREYDAIIKKIPKFIGKSGNTFNNYKNIRINSREEIPYKTGILLESLFQLPPGGLYRYPIKGASYKELIHKNDEG